MSIQVFRIRHSVREEKGVAILEAAIAIGLLLFILVLGCDFLRFCYTCLAGQYTVSTAARWAAYGEVLPGEPTRLASVKAKVRSIGQSFGLTITDHQIRICPVNEPDCTQESQLLSEELFVIRLTYPMTILLFSEGAFTHVFEAIGANEPF